jgi:hypothetical protein
MNFELDGYVEAKCSKCGEPWPCKLHKDDKDAWGIVEKVDIYGISIVG